MGTIANLMISIGADTAGALAGFKAVEKAANSMQGAIGKVGGAIGSGVAQSYEMAAKGLIAYGTAATSAGAALSKLVLSAADSVDSIQVLSQVTGISQGALEKYEYAANVLDVSTDTLAQSFKFLTRNMGAAQDTTSSQAAAFKELGVNIYNAGGQLKTTDEVFQEAINALGGIQNQAQRDILAFELFGRSATELNPLILGGAAALKTMGDEAEKAGLILNDIGREKLQGLADGFDTMKATVKAAGKVMSASFADTMLTMVHAVTENIPKITQGISKIFEGVHITEGGNQIVEGISKMMAQIGEQIRRNVTPFLTAFNAIFIGIFKGLGDALPSIVNEVLPKLTKSFFDLIQKLVQSFPQLIPNIVQGAINLFMGITEGLTKVSEQLNEMMPEIIDKVVDMIGQNAPKMLAAGAKLLISLIEGIAKNTDKLVQGFIDIFPILMNAIMENLPKLIDAGCKLLIALVDGLAKTAPAVVEAITKVLMMVIEVIISNLPAFIDAGVRLIAALIVGIGQSAMQVGAEIARIIKDMLQGMTFEEAVRKGYELGDNINKGAQSGLEQGQSKWKSTLDKGVQDAISGAVQRSAEATKIGSGFTERMSDGINSGQNKIQSAAQKVADSAVNSLATAQGKTPSIGQGIINGIISGVQAAWSGLQSLLGNIANATAATLQKAFQISSPSKLMRDKIGKPLAQGIGVGFMAEMSNLKSMISGVIPTDFESRLSFATPTPRPYVSNDMGGGDRGYKTATLIFEMDGKTITKMVGKNLVDEIRLKTGNRV